MKDDGISGPSRPGIASIAEPYLTLRHKPHKVGFLAFALAVLSFALPFASVSQSRIATGESLWAWEVMGAGGIALLLAPWIMIVIVSLHRSCSRPSTLVRGFAAAAALVIWVLVSGFVAGPAIADVGPYARYSFGAGFWLESFAAFALVVAGRRETGLGSPLGWAITLTAPLGVALAVMTGRLENLGIVVEYRNLGDEFWPAVGEHIIYSAVAIGVATVLGVGLGVFAYRHRRSARPIFTVVSAFQTIPGLALIGILVVPLASLSYAIPALRSLGIGGLGWAPLVVALTLYALLAVVRNTFVGLESVPAETVEAGLGMGMTSAQLVRRVQMPLAVPVVFSGVRTASQQTVGNATLGAFVAAGGLGPLVFLGLAQQANDLVLLGSIAIVVLAMTVDGLMRGAQRLVAPRRSRKEAR